MVRWEDYIHAAKELSPSALNLYMYLAKNQDNYKFYFCAKDYCETFNVVDKTFRNAKKELLTKGFLKEDPASNQVYFDSRGGYKETKDSLVATLKALYDRINIADAARLEDLRKAMEEADLKNTKEETVYMIKVKQLIQFAEDILSDISTVGFTGLL